MADPSQLKREFIKCKINQKKSQSNMEKQKDEKENKKKAEGRGWSRKV